MSMTENEAKTIDDCLKELRGHRSEYLKRSTPWRIINRAVRLIIELKEYKEIGTIEDFKALKEKLQGYKNQMSIYAEQHKIILASDVLDMLEELDWQ